MGFPPIQTPVPGAFNPYLGGNPAAASNALYQRAVDEQVQTQQEQAAIAVQNAGNQEQQIAREASQFGSAQAEEYNNSGVLLAGSPMLVLNQTRQLASQQIQILQQQGALQAAAFLRQAQATSDTGRAQLLGSDASFITSANSFYGQQLQSRAAAGYTANPANSTAASLATLFGGALARIP